MNATEQAALIIAQAIDVAAGPLFAGHLTADDAAEVGAAIASSFAAFINAVGMNRATALTMMDAALAVSETSARSTEAHRELVAISMRIAVTMRIRKGKVASG